MKTAFIGAGNMARAILKALLDKGIISPGDTAISDVNAVSLEATGREFDIRTTTSNLECVKGADTIILAVKPQNLDNVGAELKGKIAPGQMVMSILAGTCISRLTECLGTAEIVRAMPNTPAQIGCGMTVWTASSTLDASRKQAAQVMLSAMGKAIYVENETYIDMATAISGSGPAYFFLFMESLVEAGFELGFDKETARTLVLQTALGSVEYALQSGATLADLRLQVTSPGGTTAQAVKVFETEGFKETVKKAAASAYHRAREMGGC
ncbi:MAG: pyrroline-5-carboxylate reductase [Dehalococcoidaceae bacterium]|nr:pyrroline-5-carboxylate reductase [Dehalococcoidaceae bacterium]